MGEEPVSRTPQQRAPPLAGAGRKRGADWLGGSRGFQPPRRRARGAETQFKRRSGGRSGEGPAVCSALHPSPRTLIRDGRYWVCAVFPLPPPALVKPRTDLGRLRTGGVLRQLLRTLCRGPGSLSGHRAPRRMAAAWPSPRILPLQGKPGNLADCEAGIAGSQIPSVRKRFFCLESRESQTSPAEGFRTAGICYKIAF